MEIEYDNPKVAAFFTDFEYMQRKKEIEITAKIKTRFNQLKAADSFYDYVYLIRVGNPHPLEGNKKGLFAVSISGHKRLIIQPVSDDLSPALLKKCKKVIIKGVEDYHGNKTTKYIP